MRSVVPMVAIFILGFCLLSQTNGAQSIQPNLRPTEGMWLPNDLPAGRLQELFHFDASPAWADHLRLSSVHFGGGSGSFVSADGLVLTNHHVAQRGLQSISKPGTDYVASGFLAKARDQEVAIPGLELTVLESIEDVTDKVLAAVPANLPPSEAAERRKAAFAAIEKESLDQTGLRSHVVTLYGGAMFHLYRSKRYTDVRAVFAPELGAAFFGGDPDNFEYPRYDLDMALLRVYENGKPAHTPNFLRWSTQGVSEGDLIFVSGHPGRTERLLPAAVLEGLRDQVLPFRLEGLEREEKALVAYASQGPEQHRRAEGNFFSVQNSLKALRARKGALDHTSVIADHRAQEQQWSEAARQRPQIAKHADVWQRVEQIERERRDLFLRLALLEDGAGFQSRLFGIARTLVRLAAEDKKPDGERLREYTLSNRPSLEHDLFAARPIYPDLEVATLTDSLSFLRDKLGPADKAVEAVLTGKEPRARAQELVNGCKLTDVQERRRLKDSGEAAIDSSDDPMIALARLIDPEARALRKRFETNVEEPQTEAMAQINQIRFALLGTSIYPDATGTLRLAFGLVRGYQQDGQTIPPWTTIGGAFEHEQQHAGKSPYNLPRRWQAARENLDPQTPLNFVSTADITGGNSGSPVVNREGELVGLIFDSNRQGITTNLAYSDEQARAVAVDSRGIIEAMRKIYHADELVKELTRR
jgi:hypothetical protein